MAPFILLLFDKVGRERERERRVVGIYNNGGSCRNAVRLLSFILTTPTACILFTEVVVAIVSLSLSLSLPLDLPK